VWILPPQTSQLKLPECLYGCCSLVAVYGSPQLGQLKCSVVQRSLAMTRLCDAPSRCSSAVVCHNQRPATRMPEPGEYLISTSLTGRHWRHWRSANYQSVGGSERAQAPERRGVRTLYSSLLLRIETMYPHERASGGLNYVQEIPCAVSGYCGRLCVCNSPMCSERKADRKRFGLSQRIRSRSRMAIFLPGREGMFV